MSLTELTLNDALSNLIVEHQPDSILFLGETLPESLHGMPVHTLSHVLLNSDSVEQVISETASLHADFVIVELPAVATQKKDFEVMLGSLRNQLNAQICVFVSRQSEWQFQDFIALGFKRLLECRHENDELICYSYAIATYNHIRSWNNAKFWANPEMFGKHWW